MKKFLTLVIVFAFITLLAGCNDIKPNTTETTGDPIETSIPTETDTPETDVPETDVPETEAPETDAPVYVDPADSVTVLSNPGGLKFSTITIPRNWLSIHEFDSEHMLIMTYDVETGERGRVTATTDIRFYLINTLRGELVATLDYGRAEGHLTTYHYEQDALVLYAMELNEETETYSVPAALRIEYKNGKLVVTETEKSAFPFHEEKLTSPDGSRTVYKTTDDGRSHGGIDVLYPDGTTKRILTAVMLDDPGVQGIDGVTGYSPIQFIDNDRLLYHIGGWEWSKGYGIYNLATGEKTEFRNGYRAIGYMDGYIYLEKVSSYETVAWYRATLDGEVEKIASVSEEEGALYVPNAREFKFGDTGWRDMYSASSDAHLSDKSVLNTTVYSPDCETVLANVTYNCTGVTIYVISHGDCETAIVFDKNATPPEIADGGETDTSEDAYENVEFYTYIRDDGEEYDLSIDIPTYCYYYNGVFVEPKEISSSVDDISRVLLSNYEYSLEEFEKNVQTRYTKEIKVTIPVTVEADNGTPIIGYYGDEETNGTTTRLYVFYIPTGYIGKAYALHLWQRPELDGENYFDNVIVPIVRSVKSLENSETLTDVGMAVKLYEKNGLKVMLPYFLYTEAGVGTYLSAVSYISPNELGENEIASFYQTYMMEKGLGHLYSIVRHTATEAFDSISYEKAVEYFAYDDTYFYGILRPTDVQWDTENESMRGGYEQLAQESEDVIRLFLYANSSLIPCTHDEAVEKITKIDPADSVTVLSNPGGLDVHTVFLPVTENGLYTDAIKYDERHMLYITYGDHTTGEDGRTVWTDMHLYLIDILEGKIVADTASDINLNYSFADYTENGIILVDYKVVDEDETVLESAISVRYEDGYLIIENTHRENVYPYNKDRIVSPTGEYVVYTVRDDGRGRGGIEVLYEGGETGRILHNKSWWDASGAGYSGDEALGYATYYSAVGFADNTHLVYSIGGYEWTKGFGIYDLATGENIEYTGGSYLLNVVGDGLVAFEEVDYSSGVPEQYRMWNVTLDGTMTLVASLDETDDVALMPKYITNRLRGEPVYDFAESSTREVPDYFDHTVSYRVDSLYSADMKELLAVIEYPSDSNKRAVRNIHFCENSVTIVLPVEPHIVHYTNVEFTTHTHTYTYKNNPFYGYSTTFDLPSYCYRANGGYFEQIWHLDYPTVLRVSLTGYEYSYAEFVAGKNIYENKIKVRNPITVTKYNGEIINGYFGDYDEGGITYRLYAFYFPTEYQDKGFVLMLWEMPDNDGKYYYNNVILPIVRSVIVEAGATEVYDAILESRAPVYFPSTKEEKLLSEYLEETERSLMKYTIIDLDGDEKEEMVLFIEFNTHTDAVFLVFHRDGDIVYAHEIPYRGMNGLKTDGTFSFSSGAADSGIGKFAFLGDTYSVIKLAYSESASNNDVSYYIEDNPVRYQDFRSYWSTYYYKPDMKWTEYDETTDDNSVIEFPFDPVNFVVTLSESTGEKVLFWHQIFASPVYLYFVPCDTGTLEFTVYVYKDYSMVTNREEEGLSKLTLHLPDIADFGGVARDVVTCDSAEPVWVGGGGGSGECRFVVKLTKGDEAAYIYYNNFHYETDILDFRYAGAVPEEDLEYFMEYYPGIFEN